MYFVDVHKVIISFCYIHYFSKFCISILPYCEHFFQVIFKNVLLYLYANFCFLVFWFCFFYPMSLNIYLNSLSLSISFLLFIFLVVNGWTLRGFLSLAIIYKFLTPESLKSLPLGVRKCLAHWLCHRVAIHVFPITLRIKVFFRDRSINCSSSKGTLWSPNRHLPSDCGPEEFQSSNNDCSSFILITDQWVLLLDRALYKQGQLPGPNLLVIS